MDIVALIHSNGLVQQDEVEGCPERFSDAVLDESVDIHIMREYFRFRRFSELCWTRVLTSTS